MQFDATSAECLIFTFKEGLLSPIAHDLKIRVTRFTLEVDPATRRIDARFDPTSLRVVNAMKNGAEAPDALSDKDKLKIEENIRKDVLEALRYPEIRFVSEGDGTSDHQLRGTLTLHGVSRPVSASMRDEAGRHIGETPLRQPDFGIKPYSAMLGALRVRPDVTVWLSVPSTS